MEQVKLSIKKQEKKFDEMKGDDVGRVILCVSFYFIGVKFSKIKFILQIIWDP